MNTEQYSEYPNDSFLLGHVWGSNFAESLRQTRQVPNGTSPLQKAKELTLLGTWPAVKL